MTRAKQQQTTDTQANAARPAKASTTVAKATEPKASAADTKAPSSHAKATKAASAEDHAELEGSKASAKAPSSRSGSRTKAEASGEAQAHGHAPAGTPGPKAAKGDADRSSTTTDDQPRDRMTFLDQQRQLLFSERENYLRQADELKAEADALALEHEPGDVQFDEEGGEGGTANVDRELDLHLSAQARLAIEEIDAALAKIDAGTYGLCENCGKPIPDARLEALPHARLCVACKSGGLSSRR
jgi:DnaK suppressor protein